MWVRAAIRPASAFAGLYAAHGVAERSKHSRCDTCGLAIGASVGIGAFMFRKQIKEFLLSNNTDYSTMSLDSARAFQQALPKILDMKVGEILVQSMERALREQSQNLGPNEVFQEASWTRRETVEWLLVKRTWPELCRLCGHNAKSPIPANKLIAGLTSPRAKKTEDVFGTFPIFERYMRHKWQFLEEREGSREFRFFDMVVLNTLLLEVGAAKMGNTKLSKKEFVQLIHELMDRNGDGRVTADEFVHTLSILHFMSFPLLPELTSFVRSDADGNKLLSWEEFYASCRKNWNGDGPLSSFPGDL